MNLDPFRLSLKRAAAAAVLGTLLAGTAFAGVSFTVDKKTVNEDGSVSVEYTRAGGEDGKDGKYLNVYSAGTYRQYDSSGTYLGTFPGPPPDDDLVGKSSGEVIESEALFIPGS